CVADTPAAASIGIHHAAADVDRALKGTLPAHEHRCSGELRIDRDRACRPRHHVGRTSCGVVHDLVSAAVVLANEWRKVLSVLPDIQAGYRSLRRDGEARRIESQRATRGRAIEVEPYALVPTRVGSRVRGGELAGQVPAGGAGSGRVDL